MTRQPATKFALESFARTTCEEHPAVRTAYARRWTCLSPGIGDVEFLAEHLRRDACLRMARARTAPPAAARRLDQTRMNATLRAIDQGLRALRERPASGSLGTTKVRHALHKDLRLLVRLLL
ncbi:MAG: hypothetical protein AAF628_33470 [Planctomycetota bacterium]